MLSRIGRILLASMVLIAAREGSAQATIDSMRIYYVGRPVGWERYILAHGDMGSQLSADWDYTDRGRRVHTLATMKLAGDYSPVQLMLQRVTDTTKTTALKVSAEARHATVVRGTSSAQVDLPQVAFAVSQYAPSSQHLALLRYWKAHGSPATVAVFPADSVNRVSIRMQGVDTITSLGRAGLLTRYAIDGLVWGIEYAWLDADGRFAMFTSAAGGLSTKTVRAELVPQYDELMRIATRAAMKDLAAITSHAKPYAEGKIALVGATLIDGSAHSDLGNSTVIIADGRIVAVGRAASTKIPAGTKIIDVSGKTIVPGLWDMHAHLHQLEWIPTYIAAGVTTVRDMGNELPFVVALRDGVQTGEIVGPHVLLAGLVDGPGPNAFGAFSASTPEEGRAIVRRYHELGFEQMKLYDLLAPYVVAAICNEAHKLGMTVTGHLPRALSITAAVDSGMDQFAHLPIRGQLTPDSLKVILAFLKAHGTVIDPTESWNEIGGHSRQEGVQAFQPVLQHVPAPFIQFRVANWGSATTDPATAHSRLEGSLATIRALHEAGVPIVAGTDEGVPGFSVYREIELYVKAGFTPMDAIRAATSVSAAAMHMEKDIGTIEAGKRADLLVLDKNPLDDISNIRTSRYVMKGGVLYENSALWKVAGFHP